jgi:nuclear pore complex protein Nup53
VQTKAKMNHAFSRGPTSDFGMDSMFQTSRRVHDSHSALVASHPPIPSRQRQPLADEDAPPMNSVNDIPTEMYADSSSSSQFQPRVRGPLSLRTHPF